MLQLFLLRLINIFTCATSFTHKDRHVMLCVQVVRHYERLVKNYDSLANEVRYESCLFPAYFFRR